MSASDWTLDGSTGAGTGSVRRPCFIRTAACTELGLPADCPEILTLKWYRDDVLPCSEQGRREIDEYYAIAPDVVAALDRRDDRGLVYRRIFEAYVRPGVTCIWAGRFEDAREILRELLAHARAIAEDGGTVEASAAPVFAAAEARR